MNLPWAAGLAVAFGSTWPWARLHPRSRIVTWAATWILFNIGTVASLLIVDARFPSECSYREGIVPIFPWPF